MDTTLSGITPTIRSLVDTGDVYAEIVDPDTKRVFAVCDTTPTSNRVDPGCPPNRLIEGKSHAEVPVMINEGPARASPEKSTKLV